MAHRFAWHLRQGRALAPPRRAMSSDPRNAVRAGRDFWRKLRAFSTYLSHRFDADQCTSAAASLAYTSLLALVPLFTVIFVALSAFPMFRGWQDTIEHFVFRNFVPTFGDQILAYLHDFTDKARGLQAAGIVVLVVTVLTLMSTIESTFNVIWGIHRRRPLAVRFVVYWAVLTVGPLLIGAGMIATSYVISLPLLSRQAVSDGLVTPLVAAFPLAATTLAFVLFFKIIPYRPVPLSNALAGGIVASVLFELAKRAFGIYVTQFPSQQIVYGAFAVVPIFLVWIYLSWVIVLLGAEITQCLTTFGAVVRANAGARHTHDPFYTAYRVLLHLDAARNAGRGLTENDFLVREAACGQTALNLALERLDEAGWISRDERYDWVLTADLEQLTLRDLLCLTPSFVSAGTLRDVGRDAADARLESRLVELEQWTMETLTTPLAELIAPPEGADAATPPTPASTVPTA